MLFIVLMKIDDVRNPGAPGISFENFHNSTIAEFTPSREPDREPDFISRSGSVYWDVGVGVFRSSDHWAGMNGCTGQASCEWSILEAVRPGVWVSGYCDYSGFRHKGNVKRFRRHDVTERDILLAEKLFLAGGAFVDNAGFSVTPVWAKLSLRGSEFSTKQAKGIFDENPQAKRVISAEMTLIADIIHGDGIIYY